MTHEAKEVTPVQKRVFVAVILVIWPRFKTQGISSRGKKVHLSASVLTQGTSHHYCLGFDTNRGIKYVKNLKKNSKMAKTCKNTRKQNMWASLENAFITIRGSPCVSTTINENHLQVQRLVDPERNSASSQNLNTSRVQNLMPTTIKSTIMWSSPAPKHEETQQDEPQPYRKNT